MRRTIVIGDIHGCYDELVSLLEQVALKREDRVVAVGDLVVKGPKNVQVLDLFRSDSRFSSVIGNHDLALVRFWRGDSIELKAAQKLAAAELDSDWRTYYEYLNSLPFIIDLGKYLVVHAGLRPGVPLEHQSKDDLAMLRTLGVDRTSRIGTPWYEVYDGEQTALFGHWPSRLPRVSKKAIGLDTGCVYGNCLTAYIIETGEFITSPAREIYDPPGASVR
ncbi:MAG TPA: metallophosphoesterase family protein [Pyrinomonadaceae bacterium]|nr:metallophosphoesterase family protein [Pyrinomonadaceae bacterium]